MRLKKRKESGDFNIMYKIFTTMTCPKCKVLKNELYRRNINFVEVNMSDAESLTELYSNGIFTLSAPVLQVDDKFYTTKDLFDGENLKKVPI